MKILHVVRSLIRNNGVAVFATEVARAQARCGHEVSLLVYWKPDLGAPDGVALVEDKRTIGALRKLPKADCVHVHAIWSLDTAKAMMWCKFNRVPYVVSPHGGLMPRVFKRGCLKKFLVYHVLLKPLLNGAAAIHCTGEGEVEAVRALGLKPRVIVAPLGCRVPKESERDVGAGARTVLFLGRLGEEKGLELLLEAWKEGVGRRGKLVIAGPSWLGYGEKLREKVELEKIGGVEFVGPADEAMKERLYRAADVFVLSSPMENFSMVVLEALAYGVPVICTKGTPWNCIAEQNCGWWIDYTRESFVRALKDALEASDEKLGEMGARARRLAGAYDWRLVAERLTAAYLNDKVEAK